MSRNITSRAVVLRHSRMGEFHKRLELLTEEYGVINAVAHGAYKGKGKLTGVTEPLTSIMAYLYKEPVKNSYKITDAVCNNTFERIRTSLKRYYCASLIAELVLKSFGGGTHTSEVFNLVLSAFEALEETPEALVHFVLFQFLWRYIWFQGFQPHIDTCNSCGKTIETNSPAYYYREYGVMVCGECKRTNMVKLSPGGRAYLHYTSSQPFSRAVSVKTDTATREELKRFLFAMSEDIVETSLNTLKTGDNFF